MLGQQMELQIVKTFITYTVFGSIVLGLQGAEKSLLSTENLDGRTGRLGEVHERTRVRNEARTDKLANKRSQVGCECLHTCGEVVAKVLTMSADC
jgi:hypothetical protein